MSSRTPPDIEAQPPVYRPDQLMSEAAYHRYVESQRLVGQLLALLGLCVLAALLLLAGPSLATFIGEQLGGAVADASQTGQG